MPVFARPNSDFGPEPHRTESFAQLVCENPSQWSVSFGQDAFNNLLENHIICKKFIDSKKHQGFGPGTQAMMNSMATFFLNHESGDDNVAKRIISDATVALTASLTKIQKMTAHLEPLSNGSTAGKSWTAGFPKGASNDKVKEFLAQGIDLVDQVGLDQLANELAKDGTPAINFIH